MGVETQDYLGGDELSAGWISTRIANLAADTYYKGMLLAYKADGTATADTGNTGDGIVTDVVADSGVQAGDWVLTLTAELEAKLADPQGVVVADNINLAGGSATTVKVAGITMTITDGGTAFVADDFFTIAIEAAGTFEAQAAGDKIDAIYNGDDERVLSSAGYGQVIVGGEIAERSLVDAAGDQLTITEAIREAAKVNGFYLKK